MPRRLLLAAVLVVVAGIGAYWWLTAARLLPDRQHEAVGIVAGQMAKASGEKAGSIERRLRRKLAKNETDKLVLSAASAS